MTAEQDGSPHRRLPALRPVEVMTFEQDGEQLVLLNDRLGVAEEPIVLRATVLPFLSFFDGEHTLLELQAAFSRAVGRIIAAAEIETFVEQLDAALLLDSAGFRRARAGIVDALRTAAERPPAHADRVYPGTSEELRRYLDGLRSEHAASTEVGTRSAVVALIAPHIDYERGARCYARTYRRLERPAGPEAAAATLVADSDQGPDVFVLIGTAHTGLESLYSVLPMPFATPLGRLPVDTDIVAELEQRLGPPTDHDLLTHRSEHSLELTATYLAYALDGHPRPIVPILCRVGMAELRDGGAEARDAIGGFVEAVHEALARHGRRACFVAGADLAHVGPRFGDPEPVSERLLADVEAADRRALAAAATTDAEGFADVVIGADDRYRVCGLGAIYTVLRLLDAGVDRSAVGELVDYGQARDADGSQCVTFAGMLFEHPQPPPATSSV